MELSLCCFGLGVNLAWLGLVGGCAGVIRTGRYSGLEFGCLLVTALLMAMFLDQRMERQMAGHTLPHGPPEQDSSGVHFVCWRAEIVAVLVSDFEIKCCGGCDYVSY